MTGRTVRVPSAEDVGVTSGADLRLSSGGEIEVVSGSGVVGRVGESVDIVAGGVSKLSSGSRWRWWAADMSVSSGGWRMATRLEEHELGASSASWEWCLVMHSGMIGGAGSRGCWRRRGAWSRAALAALRSVTACRCLAGQVVVESASGLVGVGRSVEVSGSESVRVTDGFCC